jgi:uncharacterized damage-inducible protein DinB
VRSIAKSGRPLPGEYGEHAAADIARVAGEDAIDALAAQAGEVTSLFGAFEDRSIAGRRYAPGKWTLKAVLGHLIDDERIFAYRILCVARGDARPLESFDENEYVAGAAFEQQPLQSLIDDYCLTRCAAIAFYRSLSAEAWMRRGTVAGYAASVRGLAFHVAGHELHHLGVVKERYLLR